MSKDIKEYLHYYYGGQAHEAVIVPGQEPEFCECTITSRTLFNSDRGLFIIKPILRRLEDMTEEELIGLLQSMVPADMEDKPTDEDYDLELFHNDGGNLVDVDVVVGGNYSCRCYVGQIAIRECGSISLYDEVGDKEKPVNSPQAFHYLLSLGFDLFGLIPAGLAIDSATLTNK